MADDSEAAEGPADARASSDGSGEARVVDIHKSKPWHGGREFAKEIGTIVIGVLIALGAEQAVEWAHRQQEIADARKALNNEIADDARLMKKRLDEAPCMTVTLDRIGAWMNGGSPPAWVSEDLLLLSSSAWDEAKAGAVAHMPLEERIAYDKFYAATLDANEVTRAVRNVYGELARFKGADRVPQAERAHALEDLNRAVAQTQLLTGYDKGLLTLAKSVGVTPRPYTSEDRTDIAQLCGKAG